MPLTRAWAIILAFLATACLAGMFLLSADTSGGFTDADRAAVRAVTEAGVAALESQIQASPVQQAGSVMQDSRLQEALSAEPDPDDPDARDADVYNTLGEVAEETRNRTGSNMTVALVDKTGAVVAASGAAEKEVPELVASEAFQDAPAEEDTIFSLALSDQLHVAKVLKPDAEGRRLIAVERLETGAGSLLRRVLGSNNPAAVVRKDEMLGDIIGNQPVSESLLALAKDHKGDAPGEGASKVFEVGDGMNARLGSLGRIPGPAGQGDNGAMLVVLSSRTAAAGQQDLAQALAQAREKGLTSELNWPLLGGLLLVTVGLAFYLPGLEGLTPMQRLSREFNAIALGTQHSIFHDRYGGTAGEVARAAAAAHEALRQAYLAELEIEEEEEMEDPSDARSRPRTTRARRATRAHRGVSNRPGSRSYRTLTAGNEDAGSGVRKRPMVEPESETTPALTAKPEPVPAPKPAAPAPAPKPAAPAPAAPTPPPRAAAPTPAPKPAAPAAPAAAPAAAAASPEQERYREVYEEFLRVKAQCGEPTDKLTFEKFAQKLTKNASDIKKKRPEVARVNFTVYVKDGKAALKAKIVKG